MEKVNIKMMSSKALATLSTVILTSLLFHGAGVGMNTSQINLPKSVGPWIRPDSARVINSKNIFDYMNGAGELYLGYRFDHLEVYEYSASGQDNILVELYFMDTSDDAFGLLSLDWGGEPVSLSQSKLVIISCSLPAKENFQRQILHRPEPSMAKGYSESGPILCM